jgi:ribosomal protein S25
MPQKKRLKQIEKQQSVKEKEKKQEKTHVEKTLGSVDLPDLSNDELMDQLGRMRAITPTAVAIQFNIKVGMAKRLLEELRRNKVVNLVSKSHNLSVYSLIQS